MPSAALLPRVTLVVLGALLASPMEASAHLALRRSDPDSTSRLEVPPAAIRLWFTQRPQLAFSRVTLVGPSGDVALGTLAVDSGNVLTASVTTRLPAGEYVVRWQTASADAHPIRGRFAFVVLGDSGRAPPTPGALPPHVHEPAAELHAEHAGYREVRWLEFSALIAILGVIGFQHLVLPACVSRGVPTAEAYHRARRFGQIVLAAYFPAVIVRLVAEARLMEQMGAMSTGIDSYQVLFTTIWGRGWLTGVAGALLILGGWRLAAAHRPGATMLAVIGGVALAASPALTGHAAAATPMLVGLGLDTAHVLAAGIWLGGLLTMLVAGVPALLKSSSEPHTAVAAMVNSFHPIALLCAPLVVISGVGSAWMRLGNPALILESAYGRVLALKLVLFLCVALLGVHNSARARRRLGTPGATLTFRRSAWAEVTLAAVVLGVTTVLVVTPTPVLQ